MSDSESPDGQHPALVALKRLLPNSCCWGYSFHESLPAPASVPSAERSEIFRKAQAAAGTKCVANLLHMARLPAISVPNAVGGDRKWPRGFVGSLSYKGTIVIGALAPQAEMRMLGLDLESLGSGAMAQIHTTVAPEGLPKGLADEIATHFVFSAKEAVFKAQYPDTQRRLDFSEVNLTWEIANNGGGKARARCPDGLVLDVHVTVENDWIMGVATKK